MKFFLISLFLTLFLISSVTAINFDNQAYYTFDESSGTVLPEFFNGIFDGTTINMDNSNWVPGIIKNGLSFDGINEYVNITDNILEGIGSNDLAINVWVNTTDSSVTQYVMMMGDDVAGTDSYIIVAIAGGQASTNTKFDITNLGLNGGTITNNNWHMITLTRTLNTNWSLYVDSSLVDTGLISENFTSVFDAGHSEIGENTGTTPLPFDGRLDEFGIWNRSLNQSEINELYNSGIGLSPDQDIFVELISPPTGFTRSEELIEFNATITPIIFNLTNATIIVWYENGTLFNETTNLLSGNVTLSTTFNLTNFSVNNYVWNVYSCQGNGNGDNCSSATSNFTFEWRPFSIIGEDFQSDVFETSTQDFFLNITTSPDILSIDAFLVYNGTKYTTTNFCDDSDCFIETAIDIPLNPSTIFNENRSFYWEIISFDATQSFTINTTVMEQNVSSIFLEVCNATFTVQTLNFTSFNEQTLDPIDPFRFSGDFEYWLGSGAIFKTKGIQNNSASSVQLCIQPGSEEYEINGVIEYDEASGSSYTTRNYYFQDDQISNNSQDINLGLLYSNQSTSFILKVQDKDILPLSEALIFTQRFYPGTGEFRTVQVAKTDDNGKSIGFFEVETADYRFIIKKNGVVLLITPDEDRSQKVVGEETPFTLTFTVGADQGAAWEQFENLPQLNSDLNYNLTSQIVSFSYIDSTSEFEFAQLQVFRLNVSGVDLLVCNSSLNQSSGVITCNLTGNATGSYISKAIIYRGGNRNLVGQLTISINDFTILSGRLGLFLGWVVILISAFAFKFNEIAGIIMINLSMIFVNLIKLVNFGITWITAWIALSILILVVMER